MSFEHAVQAALQFRDQREWSQFHNAKDLAVSISLEAAELLELFQWSGDDLERADRAGEIREELADVLIYAIYLADHEGIDLAEAIEEKLRLDDERYPRDKARGNARKYTELR